MAKPNTSVIFIVGIVAVLLLSVRFVAPDLMDAQWLFAIFLAITGPVIFFTARDKESLMMKVTVFLLPFEFGFMYAQTVKMDLIFSFDVGLMILYALWVLNTGGAERRKLFMGGATYFALLHAVWSYFSVVMAASPLSAFLGSVMLTKAFLFYFYIINRVATKRQVMEIVDVLMLGLALQAALGILQKITGHSLGLHFLGEMASTKYGRVAARVRGTLGFPNQYAAYLDLLVPMCAALYFYTRRKIRRYGFALITLLGMFALYFSLSRSAWLGMAIAMVLMLGTMIRMGRLNSRVMRAMFMILLVVLVIAVLFWGEITVRFERGATGVHRVRMMDIAYQIIASSPFVGVGLFNYTYHSFSYFEFWQPVHNEFLRIAAETGIPGLLLLLAFIVFVVRDAWRSMKVRSGELNAVALGVIGGYGAFLGAILFGPQYQQYRQKIIFWVLAGLAVSVGRIIRHERRMMMSNQARNDSSNRVIGRSGSEPIETSNIEGE